MEENVNQTKADGNPDANEALRIVLVNEPRSYRESLAIALSRLRPAVKIDVVEPQHVANTIESLNPDLILLSDPALVEPEASWSWILLYPDYTRLTVVSTPFERTQHESFGLDDLLNVIDMLGDAGRSNG